MSAMFDDWAYHEVFEPPSPPREPLNSFQADEVASRSESLIIEIPEPDVRPRSSSMTQSSESQEFSDVSTEELDKKFKETPSPRKENAKFWSTKTWLGAADPSVYGFDSDIWQMEMSEFTTAKRDASLTMRFSESISIQASSLSSEIDWILHESNDMRKHDLASLYSVQQETESLNVHKRELSSAHEFSHDVWDENDRAARILRGPAPKSIPYLASILEKGELAYKSCSEHPDFVEIAAMEQSWRNNKQRALAIALAYSSHELRKITIRISANVKEVSGAGAVQALIFTKFENDAKSLIPIIALLRRYSACAPEPGSQSPWMDLQNIYFQLRTSLAGTQIIKLSEPLNAYTNITEEFINTCRTSFVQFRQMYLSEEQLFTALFGKPTTRQLWDWLNDSSDPLYATLRRIILHENNISRLCELVVMVGDDDSTTNESDDPNSPEACVAESQSKWNEPVSEIIKTPSMAVQEDAQNRILFRANIEVDHLAHYKPVSKDFMRTQFPTIEKSLEILGQVYEMLTPEVFNELAHRCVRVSLAELDRAVIEKIASSGEKDVSTYLYHIKQLLLLQSRIVEFDLHKTVVQEVDLSGIQKILESYRKGVSFRELVATAWNSVPKVVETMFDAMEEIFSSLRMAVERLCERFISQINFDLMSGSAEKNLELRESIARKSTESKSEIAEYITDSEVRIFLLDCIQESIMDKYTSVYRALDKVILETDAAMDIDTLQSWLSSLMLTQ